MQEIWKPVVGYEGLYEVSNLGNVRRIWRYNKPWVHPLKAKNTKDGYLESTLTKNGISKSIRTHRIVAMAFLETSDIVGKEVNHIDGNKKNNCVENLEWVTSSENQKHAYRLGLQKASGGAISNKKPIECTTLGIRAESLAEMQKILYERGLVEGHKSHARLTFYCNKHSEFEYAGLSFRLIEKEVIGQ